LPAGHVLWHDCRCPQATPLVRDIPLHRVAVRRLDLPLGFMLRLTPLEVRKEVFENGRAILGGWQVHQKLA
jgi:hypothetical protein